MLRSASQAPLAIVRNPTVSARGEIALTTDERVDGYLAKMPSEMHAVAAMLRAMLVGFGPKLTETYKWAQPVYEPNGPRLWA